MKFRFRKKKNNPPTIFDANLYVECHRELIQGQDPYEHYCSSGCRLGLDPSPAFSTRYYQDTHLASDHTANPIEHYLAHAKGQAVLDPHPLFDSQSYLEQIGQLDAGMTPLEHFEQHNATNLASPSVFFDTKKISSTLPGSCAFCFYRAAPLFAVRQNSRAPEVCRSRLSSKRDTTRATSCVASICWGQPT